ncbi:formate dehydrogenase (NAD+) [Phytophthora pseudosyringae]|uniref:Formate dehydrogenase (NAD+) n=1 Tax=Phytophthora pseudosyringae TaxID=221518 RepID=A0A8T1W3T9_9STRA|nr:formate dehydrogenase (NAD+) [Phytophthora pseudosyringae]
MDAAGYDTLQPKKRKRKYRKSTHAILKEEKAALAAELETLTARLETLKTTTFGAREEEEEEQSRRYRDKMVENRLLRRAVQGQQDQFTSVHTLANEYSLTDIEVGSSLHRFIHLTKDESSRRAALASMKPEILTRGIQLLQRRKPKGHQPWRPMRGDHCFEAFTGDFYVSSFAVMPFKRFKTVQKAFEALIVYFSNLEISRTEKFGSVTIREDNDGFNADIAQNRLVTTMLSGGAMESNTVFFSKFVEQLDDADQQREYGIVVCDFIDEDDRYPFRPETRVRRELSSVLEISSYIRPKSTNGDTGRTASNSEQEAVVVLTRWVHTRLHYPTFTLERDNWSEMCENTERWMQFLQPALLETLV